MMQVDMVPQRSRLGIAVSKNTPSITDSSLNEICKEKGR